MVRGPREMDSWATRGPRATVCPPLAYAVSYFYILNNLLRAVQVDEQPKRENNAILLLYFVVFVLIGSFFALNLFVGVTIDNFNRLKKQYEGHGAIGLFLTDAQRTWYDTLRKASGKKPRKVFQKPKVSTSW